MKRKQNAVYLIRDPSTGHIKIGSTAEDPRKRLTALQTGNSAKLDLLGRQVFGTSSTSFTAPTAKRGASPSLNPAFSLWLQGYITVWADCAERVTRSIRMSRRNSSKQ